MPASCWNLAVEQQQLLAARSPSPWVQPAVGAADRDPRRICLVSGRLPACAAASASGFRSGHAELLQRQPSAARRGARPGCTKVSARSGSSRAKSKSSTGVTGRCGCRRSGGSASADSRPVPPGVKSYRITRDRAGRWHAAFAHIPDPIPAPCDGSVVGVDRGVAVSAALSTGELLHAPSLTPGERLRLHRQQRRLARAKPGSNRRQRTELAIAKLKAREADRRRDWVEKSTTDLARRFDTIRVEKLDVRAMTRSARGTFDQPGGQVAQKRGLNRAIRRQGCGAAWWPGSTTKLRDESNASRPRTRRNDAPPAGISHPKTARAKRSSPASPAKQGRATPTSTLPATSPPDGRCQHRETSPQGGLRTVNLKSARLPPRVR